jgi:hypothetical protein
MVFSGMFHGESSDIRSSDSVHTPLPLFCIARFLVAFLADDKEFPLVYEFLENKMKTFQNISNNEY